MFLLPVRKLSLRLKHLPLFFIALVSLMCPSICPEAAPAIRAVDAYVDFERSQQFNKHIFGVHGENLWGSLRYGNPRLAELYANAGFTYIRFPGGTTANFYRWESGHFGCADPTHIDEKAKDRIAKFNRALARGNRTYTTSDFIAFLKQTGTDFSIVVNVLCETPESTRRWMQEIRALDADVRYVELGNELYFAEYAWRFPSAEAYLAAARSHALAVKHVFPAVKLGLAVSSSAFRAEKFSDRAALVKHARYRRAMDFDTLAARAPFADALVLHLYSTVGATKANEMRDSINMEHAYRNALAHFDGRFLPSIRYLSGLDTEKALWLSEWGVAFYGWQRKHQETFDSSHYNAVYFANALASMLSTPEVASANYHNLPALWDNVKNKVDPRPVFRVAELFKEPVRGAAKMDHVVLSGVGMYHSEHPAFGDGDYPEIRAVFFDAGTIGYLIIINKLNNTYLLRSVSAEGHAELVAESVDQIGSDSRWVRSMSGRSLTETRAPDLDGIQMPPFSITRVRFKIEK